MDMIEEEENLMIEKNTTEDTAMTNTINFDDLLLEETVFVSTSIAPMDMIEEEENLMIEKNTVPLSEDTTNIMEMIENAAFDFTLPEPLPPPPSTSPSTRPRWSRWWRSTTPQRPSR